MSRDTQTDWKVIGRILWDALRRNRRQLLLMAVWDLVLAVGWDPWQDMPSKPAVFFCYVLMLCWLVPWTMSFFALDGRVLLSLPVSRSARGRYIWTISALMPLLTLLPLLVLGMVMARHQVMTTLMVFTAAASFPLTALLLVPPLNRITTRTGTLAASLAAAVAAQYVNMLLYRQLNFPWFFLLLAPFTIAAVYWSYRFTAYLGTVPFSYEPKEAPHEKERQGAEPWSTLYGMLRGILVATFGVIGVFYFSHFLRRGGEAFPATVLAGASFVPAAISFSTVTGSLSQKMRLLRSLPIGRTALAAVALGIGTVAALLPLPVLALVHNALNLRALAVLPVNHVLVWMCGGVFLPALGIFWMKSKLRFLTLLILVPPAIAANVIADSNLGQRFLQPAPMPLVVFVFLACFAAAFLLLRYALLKPSLRIVYPRGTSATATPGGTA